MNSALIIMKNQYDQLSENEKKVAGYIIAHPEDIPEMSIASLAEKVGVASSGIVRMCKSLGFSGFAEVKRNLLKNSYSGQKSFIAPQISTEDDLTEVFHKVFSASMQTLEDTYKMLDMNAIEQAVNYLQAARSIHFFGVGTSATIAQDAYYRFMRLGLPAYNEVDDHIMQIAASQLGAQDVAVAISHCGATVDTVETLRVAKENNAATIAITSKKDSPICKYADICIVIYSDEIYHPIEAVSARIAHITVLDALCVALTLREPARTAQSIEKMQAVFKKKRIKY